MVNKLGALVYVPETAIVPDPESCGPKSKRDIQIMFEREREREIAWKKTHSGASFIKNIISFS